MGKIWGTPCYCMLNADCAVIYLYSDGVLGLGLWPLVVPRRISSLKYLGNDYTSSVSATLVFCRLADRLEPVPRIGLLMS